MGHESALATNLATEKSSDPFPLAVERALPPVAGGKEPEAMSDHNEVFPKLVSGDEDIVGLVAYSLYKQNKLDWLRAFEQRSGRPPNEAEFAAYIVGENTPRRVATYRFLAESTVSRSAAAQGAGADQSALRPILNATLNVVYGLLGVGIIAALIILTRFILSLKLQ